MIQRMRLLPLLVSVGLLIACASDPQSPAPTQTQTADGTGHQHAVTEALRGYQLLLDQHIDRPDSAVLLRGGFEAAGGSLERLPSSEPELKTALEALLAADIAETEARLHRFLRGMAAAVNDRHTSFMEPEVWQDFSARKIAYSGYRSVPTPPGNLVWIVDPASPAAAAGLQQGDTILSINGVSVANGVSPRGVSLVIDKPLSLLVRRANEPDQTLTLVPRAMPSAIQCRLVEGGIAYVRVIGFVPPQSQQAFLDTLDQELKTLSGQHPIGWILDLRSNSGGIVRLAAQTAARFGFSGIFAEAATREEKALTFRSPEAARERQPLVVLVNERTASSAEMLATTLRDAGLARVIGSTTAGSVRLANYFEVAAGALQITTADVLTGPARRALQGVGVTPDETVGVEAEELARGRDAQLERAIAVLAGD